MAKKYDAGIKVLFDPHLPDWLTLVPRKPFGLTRIIDSDLATVTAEADKVLLVEDPQPWILHVELQAGFDRWIAERISWYNALLSYKHKVPVYSLLVLLHRKADSPKLTGELTECIGDDPPHRVFRFQVVRAWQLDAQKLASGGWGLFPLAPLSDSAEPVLEELVSRMGRRLVREHRNIADARELGTVMDILLGLRYDRAFTRHLMEKVMNMIDLRESHGYQIILDEGKAEGRFDTLRETIVRLGNKKFGKPSAKIVRAVNAVTDERRLTELCDRILDVDTWQELLEQK